MQIRDNKHLDECFQWLLDRAKMIENPLASEADRTENRRKYDIVDEAIQRYYMPRVTPYIKQVVDVSSLY